jgi:pimeloyl-ACP methyl ester carboxylesterase
MRSQIIPYKSSFINIYFFGEGVSWLFCFHGFGETGKSFEVLENILGNSYTLAAIDLPFHGNTEWNDGVLFTPEDLLNIINLIEKNNNQINAESKLFLLGFSLGGRVALHLLQTIPSRFERVVLLAPDGLHVNFWYWLGTQTIIGNKLFKSTMKNPSWFFGFINMAYRIGFLNKSIVKFVHLYLDEIRERRLLYERWTTMRKFKPNPSSVSKASNKYQIPVKIFFGKFDRIILSKRKTFFKKAKNAEIKIIDAGHQLLKEQYANVIASMFSQ